MSDWVPVENERPREIGEFIRYEGNLCSNGSFAARARFLGWIERRLLRPRIQANHRDFATPVRPAQAHRSGLRSLERCADFNRGDFAADGVRCRANCHWPVDAAALERDRKDNSNERSHQSRRQVSGHRVAGRRRHDPSSIEDPGQRSNGGDLLSRLVLTQVPAPAGRARGARTRIRGSVHKSGGDQR